LESAVKDYLVTMRVYLDEKNDPQQRLHRVSVAAKILDISRSKAYAMVNAGELPFVRLGNLIRVPADALEEFIKGLSA
jgi:excisionase family DNA binding protein